MSARRRGDAASGANVSSDLLEEAKLNACQGPHCPDLWVTTKEGYRKVDHGSGRVSDYNGKTVHSGRKSKR